MNYLHTPTMITPDGIVRREDYLAYLAKPLVSGEEQERAQEAGSNDEPEEDEPEENACGNPHDGGEGEDACVECTAIKLNI